MSDFSGRRYSVGRWDLDKQRYVPDCIEMRRGKMRIEPVRWSVNLTICELRAYLRELRGKPKDRHLDKRAWRVRVAGGPSAKYPITLIDNGRNNYQFPPEAFDLQYEHDSDWSVLVERTDGKTLFEILRGWKR